MYHRQQEQLLEFDQRDGERMAVLCRALQLYGLQAEAILRHGLPWRETLRVDEKIKPSLIVIGSLGRSAIRELLAGSTFENVVRLSRRPVLAVPCQIDKN
jgi:nucleotide-binding universal stress UspA family protein